MRLGLAFCIVCVFLSPESRATPPDVSSLIRKFESAYRSARTLRATFLERYFDNGKLVRSDAGIAYFGKPGKMRWEYQSPEPNLYVVDGKWSWFYVPADHTVTRMPAKQSSDTRTPFSLLAGEMKVSRVCKTVVLDSSAPMPNTPGVVLRCNFRATDVEDSGANAKRTPSSAHSSYALFELDQSTGKLLRVLVVDPGGVQVEFQFTNWEFDPPVNAAKFRFEPQKGVAIVDGELSSASAPVDPEHVRWH